MFNSIRFGDVEVVEKAMNVGRCMSEEDDAYFALSTANTQIKGILINECIPYDYTCNNKLHIDNIANLYAIANLYLLSESIDNTENNKYTLFKSQADDLMEKFLNNFRDNCRVEGKLPVTKFLAINNHNNHCTGGIIHDLNEFNHRHF